MSAHIIGYARVSTNEQDLTAQRNQLALLGLLDGGHHTTAEIAELFKVARRTVYRIVHRTLDRQEVAQTRDVGPNGSSVATA